MDEYFRAVELRLTIDEFHRLPRNAAYKYEYFDGRAVLSPRPKMFTCVRDLAAVEYPGDPPAVGLRPLSATDIAGLVDLFRSATANTQPFASLDAAGRTQVSVACLERTFTGKDGPVIEPACLTAHDHDSGTLVGAVLVTLVPPAVLTDPFAGEWREPPPADAVERKLGVPHLTWVLVDGLRHRRGVGTALLCGAVYALRGNGFDTLASTFLLDNGPSLLWHWRNGFRLLPQWSVAMRRASVRREQAGDRHGEAGQ